MFWDYGRDLSTPTPPLPPPCTGRAPAHLHNFPPACAATPPLPPPVQVLTGIQQENIWKGKCEYAVDRAEIDPSEYYNRLSRGCRVSNGLGMCVFFCALCTLYAATDLKIGRQEDEPRKVARYNPTYSILGPWGADQDEVL